MKFYKWLIELFTNPVAAKAPVEAPTVKAATSNPSQPPWANRGPLSLPAWARVVESPSPKVSICIEADTAGYVKEWFALLNVGVPDQYWLEVAYQCAKMDLQSALIGTPYDPITSGKPAEFHFSRAPEFALTAHPKGKGVEAASRGREAREHYRRIRGRLPF